MINFKKGDRVFVLGYGWGEYKSFHRNEYHNIIFEKGTLMIPHFLLSFTEYTLKGFSQERPIELPEVGEDVLVYDENNSEWILRQFLKYDKGSSYPFHTSDRNSFCVKSWSRMKRIKILD